MKRPDIFLREWADFVGGTVVGTERLMLDYSSYCNSQPNILLVFSDKPEMLIHFKSQVLIATSPLRFL